jgi:hypothetical protein
VAGREKSVTSSFTIPFGAAFAGITRLRLAKDAAKKNIEDAIAEMAALTLP